MLALGREMRPDGSYIQREPMDVWVVSKDFSGSKSLLKEIASSCDELAELDPDFVVDAKQTTITFNTGRVISALPCSGAACRGKTGAVIGDEIAFWRQQEEVYGAAKLIADPNLGERRGYPILWITTPWESGSLAHQVMTDTSLPFRRWSVDIYQAVKAGFPIVPEEAFRELGIPELIDTEYKCVWARGGASFFAIDKLRDAQESSLPSNWTEYPAVYGVDVGGGRGRDNTAIVQWRIIGDECWVVGVLAFNDRKMHDQVATAYDWIKRFTPTSRAPAKVVVDQGVMGGDFIDDLTRALRGTKHVTVDGRSMNPIDQEAYAIAGRRALEKGALKIYSGDQSGPDEPGGDAEGARVLMLELSRLKSKPGNGGRLTFATPRDPTRGHCDRAWAALIGVESANDNSDVVQPARANPYSSSRFADSGAGRGFG